MKPKLVIVDDNEDVLKGLYKLFTDVGCEVITFTTGERAWTALTTAGVRPDVIILDWDLPEGMTGPRLNKKLKGQDGLKDIPVVFYTANWKAGSMNPSKMDYLAGITAAFVSGSKDGFDDIIVSKKTALDSPAPKLVLNVAKKLSEAKKAVPPEMEKMVQILKKQGIDDSDEVMQMGHG